MGFILCNKLIKSDSKKINLKMKTMHSREPYAANLDLNYAKKSTRRAQPDIFK